LNILMGESLDKVWILSDTIKEIEAPRQDQQKLMEAASMNRPDLSSLNARIQASGWELSREKASILPSLSAFGDVANDKDRVGESGGNNYTVGVKVDLPLFDPARQGRIQEARARKEQLERRVQILKDSVRQDIAQEIARYDTFRDNMTVLKGMNDDAKEAMSLAVPLYSEGRKSIADLLVIRRTYLQSAQEYNKALMGIWLSEARLLFLTGKLNEDEMKKLLPGA